MVFIRGNRATVVCGVAKAAKTLNPKMTTVSFAKTFIQCDSWGASWLMAGEGVPPMSAFGRTSCEMWLLIINFNQPLIMMVRMMKVKVV